MDFNIQQYLQDMRSEQREDHADLSRKVDAFDASLSNKIEGLKDTLGEHHTRLVVVENMRRVILGAAAALVTGAIGFLVDMIVNHLPKLLPSLFAAAAVIKK